MRYCRLYLAVICLLLSRNSFAQELNVGVAAIDITPPIGLRMSGYFSERLSTGTRDPLWAKAIALQQGETKAAIVVCDLIGIEAQIGLQARQAVAEKSGVPVKNIALCATHSHTGPLYAGSLRKHLHDLAVAKRGKDPAEEFDFPSHLIAKVTEAVQKAQSATQTANLKAGVGEERRISFNRRFHMKDGSVRFNPGRKNPDIIGPAGPIDPEVGLLIFEDRGSQAPLAALTVFALHLDTVGGTEYSADYPYYLEKSLQNKFGDSFVSIFGAGTCGDINHIDVNDENQFKGQVPTEVIGSKLGETVFGTAQKLETKAPKLAVAHTTVNVPTQVYSDDEVAKASANMHKIGTRELPFLDQVEANKVVDIMQNYSEGSTNLEVQVFRLSEDTAIVCLPGEVLVDLGLAIKAASPFKHTLVMELCNSVPAYIPTRKAFAEGSYETVNSRIAPGGGEKMVEASIRLLQSLSSQKHSNGK